MTGLQSIKNYLVEDVVVLFHGEGADDPALVQEVAVDLCAVKGTVADLNLDKVSDPMRMKCLVLKFGQALWRLVLSFFSSSSLTKEGLTLTRHGTSYHHL